MPLVGAILILGFVAVVLIWIGRANEVAMVSVRDGRVLLVRGRLPPSLLNGIADVVRRARIERATIRIVKERGGARLLSRGLDDGLEQRLRNTLGTHPWRALASAPPQSGRNFGQWLGIAWLAWMLLPRGR